MSLELVAALVSLGAGSYIAGLLKGAYARIKERDAVIDSQAKELKAYQNKLAEKQGLTPIFDETGAIVISQPPDNSPFQILRPPYQQAEIEWEAEEQANKPPTVAQTFGAFVPELTDEQKAAMSEKYKQEN